MRQDSRLNVLLVEDNRGYADILKTRLSSDAHFPFHTDHTVNLESAFERILQRMPDVILLDLSLPDSQGLATFFKTREKAPDAPIVVLTGLDDGRVGLEALRQGAQDYLVKGQTNGQEISRAIRHAVQRQEVKVELQNQALFDDLTGLYNRRGFLGVAEQQIKLAFRMKTELLLFFIDLDFFKQINDRYGHSEGDRALVDLAGILKLTFRESDLLARLGGDEFAVLAIDVRQSDLEAIVVRLQEELLGYNAKRADSFKLSVSIGYDRYDPQNPLPIEKMMQNADHRMYRNKQQKHKREQRAL